jgi:hypothetical protein
MTMPVVSSKASPSVNHDQSHAAVDPTYRIKTPFVAVHFDQAGKGRIVFLPERAKLRVIGPSSCLREGFEVMFEKRIYNVFEIDLLARSTLMPGSIQRRTRVVAVCA